MKKSFLSRGSKMFTPSFMKRMSKSNAKLAILRGERYDVEEKFLHRLFEENLEASQSHRETALVYEDEDVTRRETKFSELNASSNQIARSLHALMMINGAKASPNGDWIVLVCMKPSDQLVTTLLAIWKAGAAYLPVDVAYPKNRIEVIVSEAQPALIVYDDSFKNPEYFSNANSIKFSDLKQMSLERKTENISDEKTLSKAHPSSVAIILYTSGSSGVPKGVRIRHFTFCHRVYWQLKYYPFSATEKFCIFKTAMTFVDHIAELWCPLIDGRSVVILPREVSRNPELLVQVLDQFKIERFLGVPSLLRSCLLYLNSLETNKSKEMLSHLKMWISSGEPLTIKLAEEFFEYFGNNSDNVLGNYYGCTEVNSDAAVFDLKSREQLDALERIPLGSPLPNTIVYVLDRNKAPVREGEQGEIHVAGINVSEGYITGQPGGFMKNPMESALPFSKMYNTGDHGYIRNGLVYYTGRQDSQVKVRGNRVDISEIEKNANALEYIHKSAILVYHPGQLDQAIVAFVTFKKNFSSVKKSVNVEMDLRARLPEYMVPKVFILEEFPQLPNGKVDRQALLKRCGETIAGSKVEFDFTDVPADKMKIAKDVFEIISRALGSELRKKISADASFFELGGNSLNTVAAVAELRKNGFNISVSQFLKAGNLGEILELLLTDSRRSSVQAFIIEPLDQVHRDECVNLVATSFFLKADIEDMVEGHKLEHLVEMVDALWDEAVASGLGFMVKDTDGELIGVSLNFDVLKHPEVPENVVTKAIAFMDEEEQKFARVMNAKVGEYFHGMMSATSQNLTPQENVELMTFMEAENIKQAKANGFKYSMASNTNALTAQLAVEVFGYTVYKDIQVNQYTDANGNRLYPKAPDTNRLVLCYKKLDDEE